MYVGPGQQVKVKSQNTQGYKGPTVTAERHSVASASARGEAVVSTIQESGSAPASWPWMPVVGQPNLQQAILPGAGRRGPVYAVHQTPPPGPSGTVPTRNSQLMLSSRPFLALSEVRSPAVPATQRAALVAQTDHGTFGSQHAVSAAPALSAVQTRHHWNQMSAMTPPGQLINLSGDFNHDLAASVAAAGLAVAPAPQVRRPSGATHQGGSSLDGFWTSSAAAGPAGPTRGMTGDHMGQEMMDLT
jgi:hypothetical protein